ncbi:MAG: penicillin-insensitive murein endopeptidase [Deltaproteobacteria bacterium]|nr:penicillin-insensitive murein endopeptidase [Deltaproteobacteria bacterium]
MALLLIFILLLTSSGCGPTREAAPAAPIGNSVTNSFSGTADNNRFAHKKENVRLQGRVRPTPGSNQPIDVVDENRASTVEAARLHLSASSEDIDANEREPQDKSQMDEASEDIAYILGLDASNSVSLGGCSNGRLIGAVALPKAGPGFIHNPKRPIEARFATVETIQAIIRSAAVVAETFPDAVLVVNDLCLRDGGPIAQHGSHQNGRDVDILFYYLDAKGEPVPSVGVPLDPRGWGWDFKDLKIAQDDQRLQIDLRRTWRFIAALLETSGDLVQRIFIVEHLRSLLLQEAQRVKAPNDIRSRFEEVTCQPSTPHDDHMHVRFFCTADDIQAGCLDDYPIYPRRRSALRQVGIDPVLAKVDRRLRQTAKKRTTSPAEAKRRAGPMHARVKRFLDQRESWLPKPSPGRPFCR